jgi:hypothetical protein
VTALYLISTLDDQRGCGEKSVQSTKEVLICDGGCLQEPLSLLSGGVVQVTVPRRPDLARAG